MSSLANYWDGIAEAFEDEVLDVLGNDRKHIIKDCLQKHVPKGGVSGDFGCGLGKGTQLLAEWSASVFAVDISEQLLARARKRCRRLKNITYIQCDLRSKTPVDRKLDAVLAVNVLILPTYKDRQAILRTFRRSLSPNGNLILVVPSLESCIWVYNRMLTLQSNRKKSLAPARRKVNRLVQEQVVCLPDGVIRLREDNMKFFLKPEIVEDLRRARFEVSDCLEIEYPWREEIFTAPRNYGARKPWHWLLIAHKK